MTLNDLSEFLESNRKKILFLVLILIIGVGALIFWRSSENNGGLGSGNGKEDGIEVPAFTFAGDTWKISGQVDFSKLVKVDFPEETAVYKVEERRESFTESQAQNIAERFGFEPKTTNKAELTDGGTMFVFAKDETNLAVFSYPREIRYSYKDITAKTANVKGSIYSRETAEQKAKEYLGGKNLPATDLVFFGVRYLIYGVEAIAQTQNSKSANALEISFVQAVDGQKILGKTISEPLVKIIFNRAGAVVSLSYKETGQTFTESKIVSLLDFTEATGKLKEGGLVISILPSETAKERFIEANDLTSFTPQLISLVYYQVPETDFLIPIYLFEGKGAISDIEVYADVALSAIKP
jgi:hypothetical protein